MKINIISSLKFACCGMAMLAFFGCGPKLIQTPSSEKYLSELHEKYFGTEVNPMEFDKLALYVDYSTCISLGQHSPFFNKLVPSLVDAAKSYYSIEGSNIIEHQADSAYLLLKSIEEVNYADLKTAINRMADSNTESVLLTDGEFYQKSIAQGNANNPYMAPAFKKWLLKGHDIYILSEPYVETYKGKDYNKKRFYFIFTDNRIPGNFYDRIMQSSKLEEFPNVELFHLSADHPALLTQGSSHSTVNSNMEAHVTGKGSYEIQDWQISWKKGIEPLVIGAVDQNTGQQLPDGECVMKGIKIDRNSLGAFRITGVDAKVYDINAMYSTYVDAKEAKVKEDLSAFKEMESIQDFLVIDSKEFQKHGEVSLYFVPQMFIPQSCLSGSPYNYTKVDICVNEVQPIFEQFEDMFKFESIDVPGAMNVSVAASIQQCMTDPNVKEKVLKAPIYTIYIKSLEYEY